MKTKDIETRHPQCISPQSSLMAAAQLMKRLDVGMLPVCEGAELVGAITDRDITIRAIAQGCDARTARVEDFMSREVAYCFEGSDVEEVAQMMQAKQIRRMPVLNEHGGLVGIVSLGDLAVRTHDERLAGEVLERVSAKAEPLLATN